jgi:hypothetical protein
MWEHVQEALGKGTILNDEVAESEQRGVLFIGRVSGTSPFVGLSYIGLGLSSEQEGVATKEEDQKLAAWIETRYTPAG